MLLKTLLWARDTSAALSLAPPNPALGTLQCGAPGWAHTTRMWMDPSALLPSANTAATGQSLSCLLQAPFYRGGCGEVGGKQTRVSQSLGWGAGWRPTEHCGGPGHGQDLTAVSSAEPRGMGARHGVDTACVCGARTTPEVAFLDGLWWGLGAGTEPDGPGFVSGSAITTRAAWASLTPSLSLSFPPGWVWGGYRGGAGAGLPGP